LFVLTQKQNSTPETQHKLNTNSTLLNVGGSGFSSCQQNKFLKRCVRHNLFAPTVQDVGGIATKTGDRTLALLRLAG
jgi:hypothetical protein